MNKVKIMGILNITPDSFSDGGNYFQNVPMAVKRAQEMLQQGADILDIGGESTRPGSEGISALDEIKRVIPVIKAVRKEVGNGISISIDTYKTEVAKAALENGVNMVNSLGGIRSDANFAQTIKEFDCPLIIYHIKGTPKTMQTGKLLYNNIIDEIVEFFEEQIKFGVKIGIKRDRFIIDPGIGFGKTIEQNLEIIKNLNKFKKLDLPVLIGVSRKSHLGLILQNKLNLSKLPSTNERLEAALAETAIAISNGATIIRTHDILQTKKFITVLEELL